MYTEYTHLLILMIVCASVRVYRWRRRQL